MVKFESPFETIIEIFNERHPDKIAKIQIVSGMFDKTGAYGETFFPAKALREGFPIISIDASTTLMGTIEVLAHELAHIAVGPGGEHGEAWDAEFSAINEMFNGEE